MRSAAVTGDRRRLDAADRWLTGIDLNHAGAFTGDGPVFPDDRAAIPASIYFGEAGVWCCRALVAHELGKAPAVDDHVETFCRLVDECPPARADAVSGAAGLLLATSALVEQLAPSSPGLLLGAGDRLAGRLARIAAAGAGAAPDQLGWLGAAHGWAGIVHAMVRWSQATGGSPAPAVADLLDTLRAARLPTGLWPRHTSGGEVWAGWCHGSAGWVQLWTLVYEVLGDGDALALAEQAAAGALAEADEAGPGLCCGLAGIAYATIALYRVTGDTGWLARARRLAERAASATPGPAYPAQSLWQGDLGVALLRAELEDPSSAAMPLVRRN